MDSESYKTEICRFYKIGKCSKGGNCNFAHSIEELRKKKCAFGKNCTNNTYEHINKFEHSKENHYEEIISKNNLLEEINDLKNKIKYLEVENYKLRMKNDTHGKNNKYLLELIDKIGFARDDIMKNINIYNNIDKKKIIYSINVLNNFIYFLEETKKEYEKNFI